MRAINRTILALAAFLLAASLTMAQDHAIDAELDAAMEEAMTTADQMEAVGRAIEKWDAALNASYRDLHGELPAPVFARVKDAQRAWIAFRDKEAAALDAAYQAMPGTMYLPMHAMHRMMLVKHRALELADMLETWRLANQ
jgi:uncharacterized protein YecT (DUF1311 family)